MDAALEAVLFDSLDHAETAILRRAASDPIALIHTALSNARDIASRQEWSALCRSIRNHSIAKLVYQDPLTQRSFIKPRNYPGDADLLDMIYGAGPIVSKALEATSEIGRTIFLYNVGTPACEAVRNRKSIIAQTLDKIATVGSDLAVLSVACGYMREVSEVRPTTLGKIRRYVGVDHDHETLTALGSHDCGVRFEPIHASIFDLIRAPARISEQFDFIYSMGLFDYLPDALFVRLTKILWSRCRDGGALLIANVTRDNPQLGYLESFMDWHFLLRSEEDVRDLIYRAVTEREPRITRDPTGIVLFAELTR